MTRDKPLPFFRGLIVPSIQLERKLSDTVVASVDTLIKIVDENGGYTVIPELHLPLLHEAQQNHVRQLSAPTPVREISLVIRQDYVRERLINAVADAVKTIIPDEMLDARLKKFAIKL